MQILFQGYKGIQTSIGDLMDLKVGDYCVDIMETDKNKRAYIVKVVEIRDTKCAMHDSNQIYVELVYGDDGCKGEKWNSCQEFLRKIDEKDVMAYVI